MGLFGTKETCSICGQNESSKKLMDGCICKECTKRTVPFILTLSWKEYTVDKVKKAIVTAEKNAEMLKSFQPTKKVNKYISFDENNKWWKVEGYNIIFKYQDIISYELLEDGESLTKGGLGSAVVGGALFGGAGAVVGGITGTKKTKTTINEFRIKIVTRNEFYPEIYVNFLKAGSVKAGSILYKDYAGNAQRILSELAVIMDSMNNSVVENSNSAVSEADEIVKFKKLYDDGIITGEEFEAKKRQLLGL